MLVKLSEAMAGSACIGAFIGATTGLVGAVVLIGLYLVAIIFATVKR